MSKSGFFWNDRESRFSLIVKQRFKKHEFQAEYDRRSIQKLNEVIESQRGEIYRAHQGDEQLRRDQQLLHEQLLEQNRHLREAHEKSLNEMEELKRFSGFYIRHSCKKKISRGPGHYFGTHRQDPRITDWNSLYEWFERFSRCWISTQWKFPRYQSTCDFPTSYNSWWNAKPFSGNAEPQQWAAKYSGHTWFFGKRFCKSDCVFYSTSSAGIESMDL